MLADLLVLVAGSLVVAGFALVSPAAALIVAGILLGLIAWRLS